MSENDGPLPQFPGSIDEIMPADGQTGDSDNQSDQDRQAWKEHLERRVTEELRTKHFRKSSSMLSLEGRGPWMTFRMPCANWGFPFLRRVVDSIIFQWQCAGVILLNVFFIGYTTDVGMANALADPPRFDPDTFAFVNLAFTIFYCIELVLRALAYGKEYAFGKEWKWNIFDVLMVLLSLSEMILQDMVAGSSNIRVLKGMRMFRVLRIIRVMRYFRDLRLMVCSILQSLGSLSWAMLLLLIIMYLFSVIFMQGAILHLQGHHEEGTAPSSFIKDGVALWFSSVSDTMYTLLASIVNGVSWAEVIKPLESISMVYRWVMVFYIVFVVIGVLNVLTGIFVERACELSGLDKDLVIQTEMKRNETFLIEMKRIFEEADADGSGTISWDEFKGYMENDRVKAYLSTQQLDAFDARTLFDILNEGQGSEMSIESFIVGCQRLKGQARCVDLVAVLQETRSVNRKVKMMMRKLDSHGTMGRLPSIELRRNSTTSFNRSTSVDFN